MSQLRNAMHGSHYKMQKSLLKVIKKYHCKQMNIVIMNMSRLADKALQ